MHRNNRKMSAKRRDRMHTLARAYQFAYDALRAPLPNTDVGLELCRACHAICKEMERTAPSRYYLSGCDMARRSVADIAWLYAGQAQGG